MFGCTVWRGQESIGRLGEVAGGWAHEDNLPVRLSWMPAGDEDVEVVEGGREDLGRCPVSGSRSDGKATTGYENRKWEMENRIWLDGVGVFRFWNLACFFFPGLYLSYLPISYLATLSF